MPKEKHYIDNIAGNRQLHKKSYFIEFYGSDGKTVEDAFAFSIPPESEELTYTQRKTETKTFGGLHVDDYGIDAVKVVLSGSTVNQELKMIYRGGDKEAKWLTGEEEIYYFRDLIKKYKTGVDNTKKIIKIHDLSKTYIAAGEERLNNIKNRWVAFPGDFKIRRSSDRPFTYKYSFEFTGVSEDDYEDYASNSGINGYNYDLNFEDNASGNFKVNSRRIDIDKQELPGKLGLLQSLMNDLVSVIDFVDGINGQVNDVLEKVNEVSALLKVLGNVMSYSANTLTGVIDSAGDSVVGVIEGATRIVNGANSIVSLPREIQLKVLNVGLELQNATGGLAKATVNLAKNCRDMFTSDEYWEIPQEVLDQYAMNNEEFKDSIDIMLYRAENTANELAAAAKSPLVPDVTIGNPDPDTGAQRLVLSYGYQNVMLKNTDTLESLANQHFGDPDKAIDIATFNNIASLNALKPGSIIRIPITTRRRRLANNLIFSRREDRDNYGRDILLTDDGRIVTTASGDYALTGGVNNLLQAILLRLKESVAKRIRINAYGIRANIGDPAVGVAYIVSSIELTVISDPRVLSVHNIRFKAAGDHLDVRVAYSDINNTNGNIAGRV
jgi:hypothetical protein